MVTKYQKEFDKEIKLMLKLKHENIVEIIGQCPQKSDGKSKGFFGKIFQYLEVWPFAMFLQLFFAAHPLLLLMEYMENGSMDKYLKKHKKELQNSQLMKWTLEVAKVWWLCFV